MSGGALLNAPQDSDFGKAVLRSMDERIETLERKMLTSLLDRESYLQIFGALQEMKNQRKDMQMIYNRNFKA